MATRIRIATCAVSFGLWAANGQQDPCAALPLPSTLGFQAKLDQFMNARCYQTQNWVHDPNVRTSDGVHPFVKVWYSPPVWAWMTAGKRDAAIPDGSMVVKEQFSSANAPLSEWTIMVKDSGASFDGWYWADMVPGPPSVPPPQTGNCPEPQFPLVGFGAYCINCHAAAAAEQLTYATTRWVLGLPPLNPGTSGARIDGNIHFRLARGPRTHPAPPEPSSPCMVPESFDHVVAGPKSTGNQTFLTSDQCTGCHNATGTISPTRADMPRMLYPDSLTAPMVNLSPSGEWRNSMMGLAGRDPIFFAQLNSEVTIHKNAKTPNGDAKLFIYDACLHCHGVMGERQYKQDTGNLFSRDQLFDGTSKYAALARDGVSCTVCHRMLPDGLGTEESYTGNFKTGPPNEIYGPYEDGLVTYPMKASLGIEPKYAKTISDPAMCGSCHTVIIPVFDANGNQVIRNGQPYKFVEQSTFFEWQNSSFQDQTCQDCHMPRTYKGQQLAYKIANIEDSTFPAVDFRAPDADLTLKTRQPFSRHSLMGINVFALMMFQQFRTELGLYAADPMLRDPANTVPGLQQAIATALEVASPEQTATVKVLSVSRGVGRLNASVQVTNLVGHNFPSGVGFRRAFLNLQVLDRNNNVLWESGGTDEKGVIVDGNKKPLVTEFFTPGQQTFQPHYWDQNPIKRQDQVQVYEELIVNPEGILTTSFLALDHKVKDNRLRPKGSSPDGPHAEETNPVGTCLAGTATCDPDYAGPGSNTVRYMIPVNQKTAGAASIKATLYYQSISPNYLRDRFTDATGPDTARLQRYVETLNVKGTRIENWKLAIDSDQRYLPN